MVFQERSGEYTAECIDLDIIARGKTPNEGFKSLIDAVSGYIAVAAKGDCSGLIPRPSPSAIERATIFSRFEQPSISA